MLEVIYDDTRRPPVTKAALDALIHTAAESEDGTTRLRRLLFDIGNGTISDPDNELLASLLVALYPREVPPREVWQYLTTKGNSNLLGSYFAFWAFRLLERSSDQHIAELLDRLNELQPALRDAFRMHHVDDVPCKLLARALNTLGDEQELIRLYSWLSAAAYPSWDQPGLAGGSISGIRAWLERRPDLQKAILLEGLTRCADDDDFELNADETWDRLYGSTLPNDFALWCLDTAVAHADTPGTLRTTYFVMPSISVIRRHRTGPDQALMRECVREHEGLERRLEGLLAPRPEPPSPRRPRAVDTVRTAADNKREQWINNIRTYADDLRKNSAPQGLLCQLGMAYFGHSPYFPANIRFERDLAALLADDALTDAVMAGLRSTVRHGDIPDVDEIIRLAAGSQFHVLGPPFLAGMEEIYRVEPDELED